MATRNTPTALTSVGFQTISLSNSTASALNSTVGAGKVFHISIETQAARYRADGTAPALTTGVLLATGDHWISNIAGTALKFQRSTGTSKISIQGYNYVNSG